MTPHNLHLHRITLPEFGLIEPMLCSLHREEMLNRLQQQDDLECFETCTIIFDEKRRLTIDCPQILRRPSQDFAFRLMEQVFKHFCTGTYWFFGGVLTLLERRGNGGEDICLDNENYIQLLAVLATLHDAESKPVVLYPVDLLV